MNPFLLATAGLGFLSSEASKKEAESQGAKERFSIEMQGKQDELSIREQMLNAVASITAAGAASGITQGSGAIEMAKQRTEQQARKEVFASKTATKMAISESLGRQRQKKRALEAQQFGTLFNVGAGSVRRG